MSSLRALLKMTTISGDDGRAGWRKFDIDCQDAVPVFIAFADNPRIIVSAERNSDQPGGRLRRYNIPPDPSGQRSTLENLDPISLDGIDNAVISKDGKWAVIVSGTSVTVRNLTTDEVVEVEEHKSGVPVHAVDISPDSTTFATGSQDKSARIFSINTGNLLYKLDQHGNSVVGVKFSPNGQYLASATIRNCIWVWDARNKYTLLRTSNYQIYSPSSGVDVIPLGWSSHGDRVFTMSSGRVAVFQSSLSMSPPMRWYEDGDEYEDGDGDGDGYGYGYGYGNGCGYRLKPEDPPPGTLVHFKEPVPTGQDSTLCSLVTNGRIIACSAGALLSFWDTFTISKIGPTITVQDSILSLALSSDGSFLACGKGDKKITIYFLRDILPPHVVIDPTSHLPLINVSYPAFQGWLESATGRILWQQKKPYDHSPANQALVEAHAQYWDSVIGHARKSFTAGPSIIGHIALARALVGQGQQEAAFEAFDAVFYTCGADEVRFLVLIRAIFLFLSGKREHAVTRVKDLISSVDDTEKYNYLQVLGNMYLIQGESKEAFELFERARALSYYRRGYHLMTILLIFGLSFGEREVTHRYALMEAVAT